LKSVGSRVKEENLANMMCTVLCLIDLEVVEDFFLGVVAMSRGGAITLTIAVANKAKSISTSKVKTKTKQTETHTKK